MPLKKKVYVVLLIIVGLTGIYLVLTSDRIELDLYSLVLFFIVGGFMVYLYLIYFRHRT